MNKAKPLRIKNRKNIPGKQAVVSIIGILIIVLGVYILVVVTAPSRWSPLAVFEPAEIKPAKQPEAYRLYIPKIKVDIEYKTGGPEALDYSAWWRWPDRGNPEKGGNFILAAHRFEFALLPGETRKRSPFYELNYLSEGDHIYVDFENTRYEYVVTSRYSVEPTAIEIEAPSEEAKLTLYTCTLGGEADGREVIEAKQVNNNYSASAKLKQ